MKIKDIYNNLENIIKILKKIKIKNILILIMLLLFNTYAWFIYATKIATDITAHVSSWNIEFVTGQEEIATEMLIEVGRIYPGMEKFEKIIEVHNRGETKATLEYEIEEIRIMGETLKIEDEESQEEIIQKLSLEYPFKININKVGTILDENNATGKFIVDVEWEFESGEDEKDTMWGNKAYEFYSLNPNESSIEIKINLMAMQIAE